MLQQIFDTVVNHLRKQGRKCEIGGTCMYRGLDGQKCAAGILIPDSAYLSDMEGRRVEELVYFQFKYSKQELELIGELQKIHDKFHPASWEDGFRRIARNKGLDYVPANL